MKREIWLPVEGYEELYEVSSKGRVRSLNYNRTGETRILKPAMNRYGYLFVNLYKNGKMKTFTVHRLVANAFIPNLLELPEVNHIDEDKTNNRVENLEWCTREYNNSYGTRNQRAAGKCSKSVLQFTKSGEFIQEWSSTHEVERVLGFNQSNISKCCREERKSAYGFVWKFK